MIAIDSLDTRSLARRSDGFTIESPVKSERSLGAFKEAIGNDGHMEIDGTLYRIKGIEVEDLPETLKPGEKMGVLVAEVEDGN